MLDIAIHLHPALSALPMGILVVIVLAEANAVRQDRPLAGHVRTSLILLIVVALSLAFVSGYVALGQVQELTNAEATLVGSHHNLGRVALIVGFLAFCADWLHRQMESDGTSIWLRVYRGLLALLVAVTALTSFRGGDLVFGHGIGVPRQSNATEPSDPKK